jgi:hypothetical protein
MGDTMKRQQRISMHDNIRPYLNEIGERLWNGRAVVMVGAGFSKNAGPDFPDWNQLGDIFCSKLYGDELDPRGQKYMDVLQLAEEVQAAVGRPSLENLVRSNIPDLMAKPSSLHIKLLQLPWVDVFTTNYDTLLERATAQVFVRRYEPVVNKADIPYAAKPRIVKLHGCFSSGDSLIITREDYRRYPQSHAPFVNTVRQALLENTFCLIGFSGDDPNFLQWIGWIRDKLGAGNAPKIYLIGLFGFSQAKQQSLAERGIVAVDFSCHHDIDNRDYKKALKLFIDHLESMRSKPLGDTFQPKQESRRPSPEKPTVQEFSLIVHAWKAQRERYPGWVILPYDERQRLWASTQDWLRFLPGEDASDGLDILYGFELMWRLERCLVPILPELGAFYERLLNRYWPFPGEPPGDHAIWMKGSHGQPLCWPDIRYAWLSIALGMLRFYREQGRLEAWFRFEKQLRDLSEEYLSAGQREALNYDSALYGLFTCDLARVRQSLKDWHPKDSQPHWMVKRAALLAEIGALNEAELNIQEALKIIRGQLNQTPGPPRLDLLSQEANAIFLGERIRTAATLFQNNAMEASDTETRSQDRQNELKAYGCDPGNELRLLKLALTQPPVIRGSVTRVDTFDIGVAKKTFRFGGVDHGALAAYAFLHFHEEVGLPFRIGRLSFVGESAKTLPGHLIPASLFWATAYVIRQRDVKAIEGLFDREAVSQLTAEEADALVDNYLKVLQQSRDDIRTNDDYALGLATVLPEIISRLCCKCSAPVKGRVLDFVAWLYASPDKIDYQGVSSLVKRLLKSMTKLEQYQSIPKLLKVPFPKGLDQRQPHLFPNPFLELSVTVQSVQDMPVAKVDPKIIDDLMESMTSQVDIQRKQWAIITLAGLHELKLLDAEKAGAFGQALWENVDIQSGFPVDMGLSNFFLLKMPHPQSVQPVDLFWSWVEGNSFPDHRDERGHFHLTMGDIPFAEEIFGATTTGGIIWEAKQATELVRHLNEWWDTGKGWLIDQVCDDDSLGTIESEFRGRFRWIPKILTVVATGNPALAVGDVSGPALRLLEEMEEYGFSVMEARMAFYDPHSENTEDLYTGIRQALVSDSREHTWDAFRALVRVMTRGSFKEVRDHNPIIILTQYFVWRPTSSLRPALQTAEKLLSDAEAYLDSGLRDAIFRRLEGMLTETAYDNKKTEITFATRLELRRAVASLCGTLWRRYMTSGQALPNVIEQWREQCLSVDEFAEITNAWKDAVGPGIGDADYTHTKS